MKQSKMQNKVAKNLLLSQFCDTCKNHVVVIDSARFVDVTSCSNRNRKSIYYIGNNKTDLSSSIECDEKGTCGEWSEIE